MFKRTIYQDLLNWKQKKDRTALRILGARQIGKTTVVREFGQQEYEEFIELNFLLNPDAKRIFSGSLSGKTLITNITAYTHKKIYPGNTLLLLDEVQECPNARTAIKSLMEQTDLDVIETGSLLGHRMKEIPSLPVGFEQTIFMYPMSFLEFCWANGIDDSVLNTLKDAYKNLSPVTQTVHEVFLSMFYRYMIVGGMPKAVLTFVETSDITAVVEQQNLILDLYRDDISKYARPSNRLKIINIFNGIPDQLSSANRRYQLSQVIEKARLSREEDSFLWLQEAFIALPCFNAQEPVIPLKPSDDRRVFKLFMCDSGLLSAMYMKDAQFEILQGNVKVNNGAILENTFATQLKYNGFDLFYFNSKQFGEIDFLVQNYSHLDVLEIKSGSRYKSHASLSKFDSKKWPVNKKIVFCQSNVEEENGILYLPWYMILFFKKEKMPHLILEKLTIPAV